MRVKNAMKKVKVYFVQSSCCVGTGKTAEALKELEKELEGKIEIEFLDVADEKAQKLLEDSGAMYTPALFINNQLVATGEVEKEEIKRKVEEVEND